MQSRTTLGVVALCLGIFVFSAQDAVIKKISGDYPLTEVLAIRSVIALPVLALLIWRQTGFSVLKTDALRPMAFRAAAWFTAYACYYMAFPVLPLADATALYFTVPLFTVLLAVLFLGESLAWRQVGAIGLGFVGVMVMLNPGAGVFEPAALLSLGSAVAYAVAMTLTRRIGASTGALVIVFYQNAVFFVLALVLTALFGVLGLKGSGHASLAFMVRPWVMPDAGDALLLVAIGLIAVTGATLLTLAYSVARASVVTPFEYTGMLWAPLWGFLFFAEVPPAATVAGAALIVLAGLLALAGRPSEH